MLMIAAEVIGICVLAGLVVMGAYHGLQWLHRRGVPQSEVKNDAAHDGTRPQ